MLLRIQDASVKRCWLQHRLRGGHRLSFLEVFSGSATLTKTADNTGLFTLPPVDKVTGWHLPRDEPRLRKLIAEGAT